ncbi:hypothetical protein Anas_04624 [Armadillidium nasatum]|uniref:Uncharacterized protein n=1 Tax=Armadillidium nasatum TaxID=96803 RepID=A0A5N5TNY4_9CRUS|nr:hypothetical protein Anas_04624 [Armadillidium nasatum]
MKDLYEVAENSLRESSRKPRIVQVHLKSIVRCDTSPTNKLNESYLTAVEDNDNNLCSDDSNETLLQNTGDSQESINTHRVSSVESFRSNLQISTSYWLLFPRAMRRVLREKNSMSSSNNSISESYEDPNSSIDVPDSVTVTRKVSRKLSMKSQKFCFNSGVSNSVEGVWPVGEFKETSEPKYEAPLVENCYQVTWGDEPHDDDDGRIANDDDSPKENHSENKQTSCRRRRRKYRSKTHNFEDSSGVRSIYGYTSDDSPTSTHRRKPIQNDATLEALLCEIPSDFEEETDQ